MFELMTPPNLTNKLNEFFAFNYPMIFVQPEKRTLYQLIIYVDNYEQIGTISLTTGNTTLNKSFEHMKLKLLKTGLIKSLRLF